MRPRPYSRAPGGSTRQYAAPDRSPAQPPRGPYGGRVPSLGDSVERRVEFVAGLEALAGPVAGRRVLDLGCGRQALWTRAYVARGARVVAAELDGARCREAVARLADTPRVLGVLR